MNIIYRLKMCARPLVDERRFWLDAAIGATAQHISDVVNYFNVKNTNEANMKIANANNENAYKVALMNNQWSEKMLKYNNQFAADQAKLAREWDSPLNQRNRLLEAGINPALGLTSGAGASRVAAPQQGSSGVSPSMPVFQNAHMEPFRMLDGSAAFANLGSAIAEMANAKRTDQETQQAKKMMNDVLREAKAKANMTENAAFLDSCFSFTIKSKEVAHLANQLLLDTESINNFKQEGNKIAAEAAWTRMKEKSEQLLQKIYGEQYREAKQAADTYMERVHAEIKSMNAQAIQANAQARLSNSNADVADEEAFRKGLENSILAAIQKYDPQRFEDAVMGQFEEAKKRGEFNQAQIDKIKEVLPPLVQEMENAAKRGKPWTKEYFIDRLFGVAQSAISAGGHVVGAMILK